MNSLVNIASTFRLIDLINVFVSLSPINLIDFQFFCTQCSFRSSASNERAADLAPLQNEVRNKFCALQIKVESEIDQLTAKCQHQQDIIAAAKREKRELQRQLDARDKQIHRMTLKSNKLRRKYKKLMKKYVQTLMQTDNESSDEQRTANRSSALVGVKATNDADKAEKHANESILIEDSSNDNDISAGNSIAVAEKITKLFECYLCGRRCSNTRNLRNHFRVHTGENPLVCKELDCNQAFKHRSSLSRHKQRFHSSERPFSCKLSNCGKRFATNLGLKQHTRSHTDRKTVSVHRTQLQ